MNAIECMERQVNASEGSEYKRVQVNAGKSKYMCVNARDIRCFDL